VLPQIDEPLTRGQVVLHDVPRRTGEQDLAAVAGSRDSRGPVDGQSDIAAVRELGLTRVDTDSNPHLAFRRPVVRRKRALSLDRRGDRGACAGEDKEERVSLRIHLEAAEVCERPPQQASVLRQDAGVPLSELALEPRRPLDVREEEREGAAGQPGRVRSLYVIGIQDQSC
jgi:hypothetical protein